MRTIQIVAAGGVDSLHEITTSSPSPGPGEVLVDVHAAGMNRRDLAQLDGSHPALQSYPLIPGVEIAGVVSTMGSEANEAELRIGDRVCGLVAAGGYAEQACMKVAQCLPIPRGLDFVQAAALPEALFTIWTTVFELAGLKAGQTLLVHGGASGIGTQAIQLGRALGATVVATASGPVKTQACLDLGAHAAVDYRNDQAAPFEDVVMQISDGNGADVILDMVGGEYVARNLACLANDGAIVSIAYLGGRVIKLDLGTLITKRARLIGSSMQSRSPEFKADIATKLLAQVWPLLEAGTVKPVVDRVFDLFECQAAFERMQSNLNIGKIVLKVR